MTNKYVGVNDQSCSAKINALILLAKLFFRHFRGPSGIRGQ